MTRIAICVITSTSVGCTGTVTFSEEVGGGIRVKVNLKGLPAGKHGFHIHEAGDLREGCTSACAHFNPYNKVHGGPKSQVRHVGDLGNLTANRHGVVRKTFVDSVIALHGRANIVGRAVVIHERPDDLGKGGTKGATVVDPTLHAESQRTGNAGPRVACGVIGWSRTMFETAR